MTTLRLTILEDHVLDIIRSLEKMKAVTVVEETVKEGPPHPVNDKKWGSIIEKPSKELIDYASKVRSEWDHRI